MIIANSRSLFTLHCIEENTFNDNTSETPCKVPLIMAGCPAKKQYPDLVLIVDHFLVCVAVVFLDSEQR